MATATANGSKVRLVGLIAMILGAVFIVAGITTWGMVSSKLAAEQITVSGDAPMGGAQVADPITAFIQADAINRHALEATGGKTYAQLDKEDPLRSVAMNGSFLRASLFTSVIAFGVALFAIGVGALSILLGWGLRLAAPQTADAKSSAESAAA